MSDKQNSILNEVDEVLDEIDGVVDNSEKTSFTYEPLLTEKEIDHLLSALSSGEIDIGEINEDNNPSKQPVLTQREIDSLILFYENAKKTAQKSQSILDNINLDSIIKVKLTNLGRDIYHDTVDECVENAKKIGISKEILRVFDDEVDTNGYTEFSLKSFMTIFGDYAYEDIGYNCGRIVFQNGEEITNEKGDRKFAYKVWGFTEEEIVEYEKEYEDRNKESKNEKNS